MPADATAPDWRGRTGHVVVCGLHDDGLRMVEQLSLAGVPTLVVDDDPAPRLPPLLRELGVEWLAADAQQASTLEAAGLAGADALICAESDDLRTLAIALLARELRGDLRIVVQLRNAAVGRALSDIGVVVFDTAGLAAPSTVEACLRTTAHEVSLDEQDFLVVRTRAGTTGPLRQLYGDLAPLALAPDDQARSERDVQIAPSRDVEAVPGDQVVLIGPKADVQAAGLVAVPGRRVESAFVGARAPRAARKRPANLLLFALRESDRRIMLALSALAILMVVSVSVLTIGYREPDGTRMSVLDAFYFTVETVGTVGFGDFYFRDQHSWLRLWAILLMIVGATLATVTFALLTNLLISRTLASSLGRRKVTGLSGHVVVVGVGAVGLAVVQGLRARDVEVVVVEADDQNRFLSELRDQHVPVVIADATLPATWSAVGLDEARAVAIMTSDDLANIETGLAVRDLLAERWWEVPVVLRLFDRRLAATVADSFEFRNVRSPAALAAPWFVGAALGLDVLQTLYVADLPMLVARLTVGTALAGTRMGDLAARLRVVALTRTDGSVVNLPRRDTSFVEGDVATLIGPYDELFTLLRR
jgi:Trk K+ transport system NAD-binding subunit